MNSNSKLIVNSVNNNLFENSKKKNLNFTKIITFKVLFIIIIYITLFEFIHNKNANEIKKLIQKIIKYIDKNKINNEEIEKYVNEQNDFCFNPSKYYKKEIEEEISLQNISLMGLSYPMYIYTKYHFMSTIKELGSFEKNETINMLNALQYYSRKKKIFNNKEIYIIDIGGHTGWYPSFFGRLGYSILTFEPLETNYYILRKNYCLLNKYSNVIIITKGINNVEMDCDYYKHGENMGNGMVICNKSKSNNILDFQKTSKVSLVKLSRYIPFLSDKNIALIKLDIEGNEGKAIESGIELLSKYRVPFIFIEFTPIFLREHETDPNEFLNLFLKNGYKISSQGFLSNNYSSIENILEITTYQINLYFIHTSIIENL